VFLRQGNVLKLAGMAPAAVVVSEKKVTFL
jgi:hypothetical protein